jgi:hypothetical protein
MNTLGRTLIFLSFFLLNVLAFSQQDSSESKSYDFIYLKSGATLKGDILSFNEKEGSLVFRDIDNRVYSVSKEEYLYFKENIVVIPPKEKEIRPRKYNDILYSVGFSWTSLSGPDYYYELDNSTSSSSFSVTPICAKLAVGKLNKGEHYYGLTTEFALTSGVKNYVNVGLRYAYTFTADQKNVQIYIPAELKYHNLNSSVGLYGLIDNEFFNYRIQSVGLNLGTGISFIRDHERAISLEVMLTKHVPQPLQISNMPERVVFKPGEMRLIGGAFVLLYSI